MLSAVDPSGRAGRHVGELVEDVIDAFVGLAGATAVAYIADVVPGFKEQFDAGRLSDLAAHSSLALRACTSRGLATIIRSHSSSVTAKGFSQRTCTPARAARMVYSACMELGSAM